MDRLAERVPAVLISSVGLRGGRRCGSYFTPEKTLQIGFRGVCEHARRDEDFGDAVVVEIDTIGCPGPAAHFDAFRRAGFLEGAVAVVAIERIAFGMPFPCVRGLQGFLRKNALTGVAPQVR